MCKNIILPYPRAMYGYEITVLTINCAQCIVINSPNLSGEPDKRHEGFQDRGLI
jgi:hypothetical protein